MIREEFTEKLSFKVYKTKTKQKQKKKRNEDTENFINE